MSWCLLCLNVDPNLTFYITTHSSSLISLIPCKGPEIWEGMTAGWKDQEGLVFAIFEWSIYVPIPVRTGGILV